MEETKIKKEKLFNLKITDELRRKIKKDAYEKDKSASAIVREILENYYSIKDNNDSLQNNEFNQSEVLHRDNRKITER